MPFLPKGLPQSHQQESTAVKNPRLHRHARVCLQTVTVVLHPIDTTAVKLISCDITVITLFSVPRFSRGI